MPTQVRRQIARILKDKRHRNEYLMVLALMALTVALGVASVLTQQGHAATKEVQVLDCPVTGTVAHTHDDSCYDEDGNLVCPLPEVEAHIHDDSCYADERVLVCGLEEGEDHTHTDSCYEVERTLVCGRDEIAVSHVHGPGCFATVTVPAEDEAAAAPESTEQPTDRPASETHPAQKFNHEFRDADGSLALRVDVDAPEGALPAGSTMVATWVDPETLSAKQLDAVDGAIAKKADGQVLGMQAVDISFRDASGAEVEPAKKVTVTMTSGLIDTDDRALVVHIDDLTDEQRHRQEQAVRDGVPAEEAEPERSAEAVEALSDQALGRRDVALADDQLAFDSDRFSTYVLAVTSLRKVMQASDGATVTVTVDAPAEAGIPQGAELQVREVAQGGADWQGYRDQALAALDADEAELARFFDIAIVGEDGTEVQPAEPVSVEIALADAPEGAEASVVHFGEGAEVVPASEDAGVATFDAAGFSVYGVVYTVDFHWTVDGQGFEYNLQGGGAIGLRELLPALGAVDTDQIEDFLAHVADVTFSDPELLAVEHVTEDTTVGTLVEGLGLLPEQSADLGNEELAEMLAKPLVAPDWALVSLQPFDSDETLTITMTNGETLEIKVTDENITIGDRFSSNEGYILYTIIDGKYYAINNQDGVTYYMPNGVDDLESLGNEFKWKINWKFNESQWQFDWHYDYYEIRSYMDDGRYLYLANEDTVVKNEACSVHIIDHPTESGAYAIGGRHRGGGGFTWPTTLNNYSNGYLYADRSENVEMGYGQVNIIADYAPMYIYQQAKTAYEFTVQTEDIRRGAVAGTNTAEEQVSNSGLYLTKTTATSSDNNKKNRYPITATPSSDRLVFSHWTLNDDTVPNMGATIPAGGITIPGDGAVLEAHFKKNENYTPTEEEKLGRNAMDKDAFEAWLNERLADRTALVNDGCDKTAEVYDYENRIYRVDLTAQSKLPIFDGDVDLAFLIDVSGSMKFPSSLINATDVTNNTTPKNLRNIERDWSSWGLKKNKTYYVITDPESTSTVCVLWYNGSHWMMRDASKNPGNDEFRADVNDKGAYFAADKPHTLLIKEATDLVTGQETGSLAEAIQNADLSVGQPKTRRVYLEASIKDAIKEMYSIKQRLAYAQDSNKDYQPKIAYNQFCGYIYDAELNFVAAPQNGNVVTGYSYDGGTSTDAALLNAAGKVRSDIGAGNAYETNKNNRGYYSNWKREYDSSLTYSTGTGRDAGFQWDQDSTKRYAMLITDGAPQRSSRDIAGEYLYKAKEFLDEKGVTLVSVGLSMKDVKKGSELLYNISDVDDLYVPYYYRADTGDQLSNVIYETLSTTLTDAIVVGNVTDTVNEAFYPVDRATGNPLADGDWIDLDGNQVPKNYQGKHGVISYNSNTDSYSVKWSDQSIKSTGWHGSIYVKAKEDLLGGNAVLTNDGKAKVEAYGYKNKEEATTIALKNEFKKSVELDSPRVNVNELAITNNDSEWTVYVGEQVDPLAQLKALYDNIDVIQVVNNGTDTNHDGFIDKVNKDSASHAYNNNMFYPLPADEDVDAMRSDGRESEGSGTRKTFKLKDLIKKLQGGADLDWNKLLTEAQKTGTEDDPEEQQNKGIVIRYNDYDIPGDSTITIKLTKDIKPGEPDISNTAHEATVVGDDVETYTLSVIYEPDYKVLPSGQGGEADIADFHVGQFESKYQGTAAGRETRENTHVINVYAEPLDVLKVDGDREPLPGATFGLYRAARPNESTEDIKKYDSTLTGSYHCVSTATSGDDGIAHLAPVEDGDTKWDVIAKGETYYLIETSAPAGYKRDSTTKVVTVETTNGLYTNLAGTPINAKTYPFNWNEGVTIMVGGQPATIVPAAGTVTTLEDGNNQTCTYILKSDPVTFQTTIENEKIEATDINILKVDNEGNGLPDAVFQLKVVRSGSDVLVTKDSACSDEVKGVGDVTVKVNGEDVTYASAFKSTADNYQISGLPDGTYKLVEVQAPAGYVVTVPEIEFTIADGVVTSTTATSSADVKLAEATGNTLALLTITNTPGQPLPNAGGSGTTLFYVVGGLLMAGAAVAAVRDRRRASEA